MNKPIVRLAAVAVVALFLITACEGLFDAGGDQIQAQKVFSMDLFEQNVRDTFADSVGFTYAIAQNGKLERSGEAGVGRTAFEGLGPLAMHRDQRMHIASISKTITTAAVLRLLQDTPDVFLNSPVAPYLPAPAVWPRGPGINSSAFSFRHLLAHRSGLDYGSVAQGEIDARLADHIAIGVIMPQAPAAYDNVNHALFRVIIPNLLGEEHTDSSETLEAFHARIFGKYVQDVVFTPAGVPAPRATTVPPANGNRYYPWPYDNQPGVEGTDFSLSYGAYGWYMSVVDLIRVMAHLRFTEDIISNESRAIMDSEELGWWNTDTGDHGTYTMKQGGWFWGTGPVRGTQSIIANFSAGVQAAVIVNSRPAPTVNMALVMRDAFDNAFVSP